jgi:hypothetical protein
LNSTTSNLPETPVQIQPVSPQVSRSQLWKRRAKLVIQVMFLIELGMVLAVSPWTPIWSQNSLLTAHPAAKEFLGQGFMRGAFTGLGLINIWMGIWEAVQYREDSASDAPMNKSN